LTGFQPSLVRRLVLAFTLGPVVAFALLLLAIRPSVAHLAETNTGPDVAIVLIAAELERRPDGSLTVASSSPVHRIAARSDRFWYVVGDGRSSWSFGSVPEEMRRFRRQLSGTIKEAQFGDPEGSNRAADWSVMQTDTPVGPMTIYAGGVNPDAIGNMEWLLFAHHDQEIYIGLILLALVYAAGWPLAVPIVLAALRPTARAASHLDPSRPDERLPEARVVKELRPIVQSFNAALDRLAAAYERRRRFIADIAHELRTPLAVLTMHVEETPESGNKSDLQRTVYRLHQMVGQMLDAERLAMTNRAHDPIDLVDLARSTVAEIAPLAIANGYEMSLKAARNE
jgi:signal transduction histidine kinase